MIRSMTGFGRGKLQAEGIDLLIEIRAVNHRYCDVFIRIPRQIGFLEEKVRDLINKSVSRGKLEVFISYEDRNDSTKNVSLDEPLAKTYINALEKLRDNYNLKDDISVSLVSGFLDVLKVEKTEQDETKVWEVLKTALNSAIDSLISMREYEGQGLKKSLIEKVSYIEGLVKEITLRAPDIVKEYKSRLESKIREILDQQSIDENRIAMEIAIFADKCSIDEEIVRLKSHFLQFRDILENQTTVGRKLDFLVQEMNREINTIGSKANNISITRHVVDVKSEIEKIREQIQNIE